MTNQHIHIYIYTSTILYNRQGNNFVNKSEIDENKPLYRLSFQENLCMRNVQFFCTY